MSDYLVLGPFQNQRRRLEQFDGVFPQIVAIRFVFCLFFCKLIATNEEKRNSRKIFFKIKINSFLK